MFYDDGDDPAAPVTDDTGDTGGGDEFGGGAESFTDGGDEAPADDAGDGMVA